jgi:hypothetical protein
MLYFLPRESRRDDNFVHETPDIDNYCIYIICNVTNYYTISMYESVGYKLFIHNHVVLYYNVLHDLELIIMVFAVCHLNKSNNAEQFNFIIFNTVK